MAKILGLGGIFFKCSDVDAYRNWWAKYMGVDVAEWGSIEWASDGKARTIFGPFKAESTYFEPSDKQYMINLRVDNVRELLKMAKKGGATLVGDVEESEYGIFGWFIDPEGIKIELWQEV